jgi:hypothetical protein
MVNQLIQKKGKLPIVKPELQITLDSVTILEKKLFDGFTKLDNKSGEKSFVGLKSEFDNLKQIFNNSTIDSSIINVDKIKKLTSSLYLQGLKLLSSSLEHMTQLGMTDYVLMETELTCLEDEYKTCSESLKPIVLERIEKNKSSLKAVKGYRDKIDELLCEAGLCKDAIREIRLKLPELMSHKPKDEFDEILHEINSRMSYAERVKKEYEKQGL